MIDIKSMDFNELEELMVTFGEPKYRAKQLFTWLQGGAFTFDEMTNLSKKFRNQLAEQCTLQNVQTSEKHESKLDSTVKYVFLLNDGQMIETVVMKYHHGNSICISTQAGCKMGCVFCASGKSGYIRNLTVSEMLDQIIFAQKDLNIRISNVVLMGVGEPFDNYDNVVKFLKLLNHEDGLNIGYRHISISTCGLVPQIEKFTQENLPVTLSISLHAPFDELRSKLMPINKSYNIDKLLNVCDNYSNRTGRRISYEYILISGVNDSKECIRQLTKLFLHRLSHINIIPVNSVKGENYHSTREGCFNFAKLLESNGINATVRRTLGSDIDGACGQLRRRNNEEKLN